jgi:hypothetical protein
MSIGNAIKIGVACVAGFKLATWSYKVCKAANSYQKKLEFLAQKNIPMEKVLFATEAQLDALIKEYA